MKRTHSHEDAFRAHGEAIAAILEEKQNKSGIRKQVEALLRDSFRAVAFAIDSGTGQLVATLKAVPRARMYNIRFAPVPAAGAIVTWTTIEVATAKPGVPINNLMPGTIYTFQARAFGKLGFSDWSDPVNRMCI